MVKNEATGRTDSGMEHFGYKESLDRSMGFGSFAAGVSYFLYSRYLPAVLLRFATPAGLSVVLAAVLIGQLAVALCFMSWGKYHRRIVYNGPNNRQPIRRLVFGLADAHRVDRTLSAVCWRCNSTCRCYGAASLIGRRGAYDFATNAVVSALSDPVHHVVNALGVRLMGRSTRGRLYRS